MRKKKEKKKDFQVSPKSAREISSSFGYWHNLAQKPKLRVGKTKAKADNFTDTSFKAKCGSWVIHFCFWICCRCCCFSLFLSLSSCLHALHGEAWCHWKFSWHWACQFGPKFSVSVWNWASAIPVLFTFSDISPVAMTLVVLGYSFKESKAHPKFSPSLSVLISWRSIAHIQWFNFRSGFLVLSGGCLPLHLNNFLINVMYLTWDSQMLIIRSYRIEPTVFDYGRTFLFYTVDSLSVAGIVFKIGYPAQRCNVLLGFTTFKRTIWCPYVTCVDITPQAPSSHIGRFYSSTSSTHQTLQDTPSHGRIR